MIEIVNKKEQVLESILEKQNLEIKVKKEIGKITEVRVNN
jgi:hypothetical protein